MDALLLDRDTWDLCIDASGRIAVASDPYAIVQNVATAARLFTGELWYGPPAKGIPFFTEAFNKGFPTAYFKARIVAAALAVPGVASAKCVLSVLTDREIGGQIQITTTDGANLVVGF